MIKFDIKYIIFIIIKMNGIIYPLSYSNNTADYDMNDSNYCILNNSVLEKYQNEILQNNEVSVFRITHHNKEIGITNCVYLTSKEFTAPGLNIYIPFAKLDELMADIQENVLVDYYNPPQASHMKLKPMCKEFYEIDNIKENLEKIITKYYPVIQIGDVLTFKHNSNNIKIKVESLEPDHVCRTTNTDLNVDFVPPDKGILPEPELPKPLPKNDIQQKPEIPLHPGYKLSEHMDNETDNNESREELSAEDIRLKRLAFFEKH